MERELTRRFLSSRRPNVKAQILTFSCWGDTTLVEYDSTTADMEDVNHIARGPLPIAKGSSCGLSSVSR